MQIQLSAVMLGMVGTYLTYLSWKQHNTKLALAGWFSVFATVPMWIVASGPEFGVIYALCLSALFPWLGIIKERKTVPGVSAVDKSSRRWQWQGAKLAKNLGHTLYVVPILLAVSTLFTLSTTFLMPLDRPTQMAMGVILLPLFWGGLAYWYLQATNKRPALLFTAIVAMGCGYFLFG